MDELPELTEDDKKAIAALDMTEILGSAEERITRAVNFAVARMRECNTFRQANEQFRQSIREALEMLESESDRTLIKNHLQQAIKAWECMDGR